MELEKLKERSNMLASQHAMLSDGYKFWALVIDLSLVFSSGALLFFSIAAEVYTAPLLNIFGYEDTRNVLPFLTFVVFLASLVEWRIGFKFSAQEHEQALNGYARVKRDINKALKSASLTDEIVNLLKTNYDYCADTAPAIPEKKFLKLKKKHLLKIKISKALEITPGAHIFVIRMKIWIDDNFRKQGN